MFRTTRRKFCSAMGLAVGACCISTRDAIASPQEPELTGADPEIGRHIYKSLKWNMVRLDGTLAEKFAVLKEIGYDGLELDSPSQIDAAEALAASDEVGLPIEGIVNSTHWDVRHSDPSPTVREQALANMKTAMQFASDVQASSVLLVPGKVTDANEENHQQVWDRSISELRKLLPLAERLEVQILIENVGNGFCEHPQQFADYIDEIDSRWVGVHFDIGNHIRVSPPADWIRVLNKRIKKLDIKDRTRANERTLIGQGEADWPSVRQALEEIGYQGWAAAEVPGGDRQRLSEVLARMNQVLGKSDGRPPK